MPQDLIPEVVESRAYTYKYKKVSGSIISANLNPSTLDRLLTKAVEKLWSNTVDFDQTVVDQCYEFYRDKSYSRLRQYCKRFEQVDCSKYLNGAGSISGGNVRCP